MEALYCLPPDMTDLFAVAVILQMLQTQECLYTIGMTPIGVKSKISLRQPMAIEIQQEHMGKHYLFQMMEAR